MCLFIHVRHPLVQDHSLQTFVFILFILAGSMKPQPPVTNDVTGNDEGTDNQTKTD